MIPAEVITIMTYTDLDMTEVTGSLAGVADIALDGFEVVSVPPEDIGVAGPGGLALCLCDSEGRALYTVCSDEATIILPTTLEHMIDVVREQARQINHTLKNTAAAYGYSASSDNGDIELRVMEGGVITDWQDIGNKVISRMYVSVLTPLAAGE